MILFFYIYLINRLYQDYYTQVPSFLIFNVYVISLLSNSFNINILATTICAANLLHINIVFFDPSDNLNTLQ